MLPIRIDQDERLQEIVEKYISGLLPHEEFSAQIYSVNLNTFFRFIKLEELKLEYYAIFKVLESLNRIKTSTPAYVPKLTRNLFIDTLEAGVERIVLDRTSGMKEYLDSIGQSSNLELEDTVVLACQKLMDLCIELYDRCFELKVPSTQVPGFELSLTSILLAHIGVESVKVQAQILNASFRLGRKLLQGPNDWLDFTSKLNADINSRFMEDNSLTLTIDSEDKLRILAEQRKSSFMPLGKYGLPPLDDMTPILRHRLVVIVAKPGVGKTTMMCSMAGGLLMEGKKVAFMCGESSNSKIFDQILVNYMHRKYKLFITMQHLSGRAKLSEEQHRLVRMAESELASSGLLTIVEQFTYDNLGAELRELHETTAIDAVFIDHTLSLAGGAGMTLRDKVNRVSEATRDFKKKYPVYVGVASHLASEAEKEIAKDGKAKSSPTAESSSLEKEADEIIILYKNEILTKSGLLAIQNFKRRDAQFVEDIMYVKKKFSVMSYEYDVKYQAQGSTSDISAEMALKQLSGM